MTQENDFSSSRRHLILIVLTGLLLGLPGLGSSLLWDQDEGFYASVSREMHERSDWIVPTFNQELFAHKPPVMYWGMMLGIRAFGLSEWSVRIVSVLMGIGTSLITYLIGRKLFPGRDGATASFYGALVLLSSIYFSVVSRSATADAHLTFFIAVSIWCWLSARGRRIVNTPNRKSPIVMWIGCYSAMGLAVLTKGPIGFLFPMTIIGWVTWRQVAQDDAGLKEADSWRRRWLGFLHPQYFFRALWEMKAVPGLVLILIVSAPWYWAVEVQSGGKFFAEFFGVHHWQRFSQSMDNHSGPWFYYIAACVVGFYPWSTFAIPVGVHLFKSGSYESRSFRFLYTWIAVYFIVFSMANTKLPNYVLPAYPAIALLIGSFVASWSRKEVFSSRWIAVGWIVLSLVGFVFLIPRFLLGGLELPEKIAVEQLRVLLDALVWLAVPLMVTGLFGWFCYQRNLMKMARQLFGTAAVIWILVFWLRVVPVVDRYQGSQRLVKVVHQVSDNERPQVVSYRCFRPSLVYYLGGRVEFAGESRQLRRTCRQSDETYVIMTKNDYEDSLFDARCAVETIDSRAQFPWQADLRLLKVTRKTSVADRLTKSSPIETR
ncbi:MAG: glycosyltransferase family 39 protein [Planctomycetaceae bacterium]|nr:glycosyltransferase family 39 protein [Planctomycetaceae bacterium]